MIFEYQQNTGPVLVSFPHDGEEIPDAVATNMTEAGRSSVDTDWYVSRVYDFLQSLDVSFVKAKYSRFVVDLNRSTDGAPLYPGQSETALCPVESFDGRALYGDSTPSEQDIQDRVTNYWKPYHEHIERELDRIRDLHGYAILWDAHSIRGRVPKFFQGTLPDLNFGTADGESCPISLIRPLVEQAITTEYSTVLNGRFKGGYITRHYGNPVEKIYAIQLEINQDTYLETEWPPVVSDIRAKRLSEALRNLLGRLIGS